MIDENQLKSLGWNDDLVKAVTTSAELVRKSLPEMPDSPPAYAYTNTVCGNASYIDISDPSAQLIYIQKV